MRCLSLREGSPPRQQTSPLTVRGFPLAIATLSRLPSPRAIATLCRLGSCRYFESGKGLLARDKTYSKAMQAIATEFPGDLDATALSSLAVLGFVLDSGSNVHEPGKMLQKVRSKLLDLTRSNDEAVAKHPGILHCTMPCCECTCVHRRSRRPPPGPPALLRQRRNAPRSWGWLG